MRTSQQLRRIIYLAESFGQDRGDTEWSVEDRQRVDDALAALEAVGPITRRYSKD